MLFNSFTFIIFFVAVYFAYLLLAGRWRLQNTLLLAASYVFYGFWDWRFISLIIVSTLVDFTVARLLDSSASKKRRKALLSVSVATNLSILGFFKYFNFFADSFADLFRMLGFSADLVTLEIILPVGISFYTFQTLGYSIDVYRKRISPCTSLPDFALFVAFFPQLVAGPIERAARFLPQIQARRIISAAQVNDGLFLILWGFFKKMVVADRAGLIVNQVFDNYADFAGLDIVLAALAFTVQLYGDFSGYTDIARGLAKLMGFELTVNFRLPFFALNPSDFWRRWHISLSEWLRDYLYIPLGGNKGTSLRTYRNVFITLLLGGLWHGAAWNFVFWGVYHAFLYIPYLLLKDFGTWLSQAGTVTRFITVIIQRCVMFLLTVIGMTIFRSASMAQFSHLLVSAGLSVSSHTSELGTELFWIVLPVLLMQFAQHVFRDLLIITKSPWVLQILLYAAMILAIIIFGVREPSEFIYYQF